MRYWLGMKVYLGRDNNIIKNQTNKLNNKWGIQIDYFQRKQYKNKYWPFNIKYKTESNGICYIIREKIST